MAFDLEKVNLDQEQLSLLSFLCWLCILSLKVPSTFTVNPETGTLFALLKNRLWAYHPPPTTVGPCLRISIFYFCAAQGCLWCLPGENHSNPSFIWSNKNNLVHWAILWCLKKIFIYYFPSMWVLSACLHVCHVGCWYPKRSEEGAGTPKTGVKHVCEPPCGC